MPRGAKASPRQAMPRGAKASSRQGRKPTTSLGKDTLNAWLFLIATVGVPFVVAYLPLPDSPPFNALHALCLVIFRSTQIIRIYCLVCLASHLGQGTYAWYLARTLDPSNAWVWFWQTFAVGFFSLRLLVKRSKTQAKP